MNMNGGNKMGERLTNRNVSTASAGIGKVIAIDLQLTARES
jgi:hypothetical protein